MSNPNQKTRIVYATGVSESIDKETLDRLPLLLAESTPERFHQGMLTLPSPSGTILADRRQVAENDYIWYVGTEETGMDWVDRPRIEVAVSDEADKLDEQIISELVEHTIASVGVGKPGRVAVHKSYNTPSGVFDTFLVIKKNEFHVHIGTPDQIKQMANHMAKEVEKKGGELMTWKSPKTKAMIRKMKRLEEKKKGK